MNWLLLLAQDIDPDKTIDTLDRVLKGGVPLICLCIAVLSTIAAVFIYRMKIKLDLEYRTDLVERAKQEKLDFEKRIADAKTEAKDRAQEVDKLMRERLLAEKESDATLAHAVRMIEHAAKQIESSDKLIGRLERKLES